MVLIHLGMVSPESTDFKLIHLRRTGEKLRVYFLHACIKISGNTIYWNAKWMAE